MMQILEQLGAGERVPEEAIRSATADRAVVAPLLVKAIERHEAKNETEENGLFIAFHLLGQWREKSAYRALARFLRWPDVNDILGEAVIETSHRVMAGVFDGDPGPIYEVIHDVGADEFVRKRMFDTLVILVLQGELERARVADFLRSAFTELQPQDQSYVWSGWQGAIAMLALTELEPLAKEAFRRGFIDELDLGVTDFESDLRQAVEGQPLDEWQREEYAPFGDVIEELSDWACFQPKKPAADDWQRPVWSMEPAHNPYRGVGRNDPCPCGSGKKFKKCCLGKVEAERQAAPAAGSRIVADEPDDGADLIREYDPLVAPDPEVWLAADEQHRIDIVVRYHRRHGFDGENITVHAVIHSIVESQIAEGDRWPVRRALSRLMAEGLDRHDAIHAIGWVLAGHINDIMRRKDAVRTPDYDPNAAYFSELERLTAEDWLNSR